MARAVDDDEATAQEVLIRLLAGDSADDILRDHPGPAAPPPPAPPAAGFDRASPRGGPGSDSAGPITAPTAQRPGNALTVRMGAPKPKKK